MMSSRLLPVLSLLALGAVPSAVCAAEGAPAPAATADAVAAQAQGATPADAPLAAGVPSNWTRKGRLGAFLNNTTTTNADASHDATISGTNRSTTFLGTVEGDAEWKEGKHSVQNGIKAKYGRTRTGGAAWTESDDEIRYDGVYRYAFHQPHFAYGAWGFETVFSGPHEDAPALPPDDWSNHFDPFLGKVSAGYGQIYENLWVPEKDRLEARLGARAQKHWGSQLSEDDRKVQTGIEAFARYERVASAEVRFFGQYEGFSEFRDVQHVTNLVTAGLTVDFASVGKALGGSKLTVELALRAFYETRPEADRDAKLLPGYSEWSVKQDTLVGATYLF